jgi:hypothetical protein
MNFSSFDKIDISNFSINKIKKLLKDLAPTTVITLGFVSIYELLISRITKSAELKLIYLEHGIFSKETTNLSYIKILTSFGNTVIKNVFFIFQYFLFAIQNKNTFKEMIILYQCLFYKKYYKIGFDKAIFFSNYGFQNLNEYFNFTKQQIFFSGYPLVKSNQEYEDIQKRLLSDNDKNHRAIYIHQPFIKDNLVRWKYSDEKSFILNLAQEVNKSGLNFDLLIHPRENIEFYRDLYKNTEINVLQNIKSTEMINYQLAIGHYSTALLFPIFFKIPIWIINYNNIHSQTTSIFRELNTDLNNSIKSINYEKYIDLFIGTKKCSFENVSNTIELAVKS